MLYSYMHIIRLKRKKKFNNKYKRFEFELKQHKNEKVEFFLVKNMGLYQILINGKVTDSGMLKSSNVAMSFIDCGKKEAIFIMLESKNGPRVLPFSFKSKYSVFIGGKVQHTFED